jgi:hypothetical protein
MKQLILAPLKAYLGDDYLRLRNGVLSRLDIWANRIKNLRYRVFDAKPLHLDAEKLRLIKRKNRESCRLISPWCDRALFARSVCNYGISPDKMYLLDTEIGSETTLSDFVSYECMQCPAPIRYLEIGVSVGKNFVQVMNGPTEGSFSGFDIEDINPAIMRDLELVSREEWPSLDSSAARRASGATFSRPSPSSLQVLKDRTGKKTIRYVAGDVFDERCWQALAHEKYNVIFSDALHTGPAIKHEYSMMKKYDLFGRGPFVIIWDDLHFPGMREAYLEITDDLQHRLGAERTSRSLHLLYGWAGRHEGFRHLIGVFRKGM